jgi:hypothetical protein
LDVGNTQGSGAKVQPVASGAASPSPNQAAGTAQPSSTGGSARKDKDEEPPPSDQKKSDNFDTGSSPQGGSS